MPGTHKTWFAIRSFIGILIYKFYYVCFQWQRLSVFSGVSRHIFNPSKIPQISPTNNSHRPQPTPSPPSARAKNRAHASAKTRGRSPRLSSPSNGNGNDSKKSPSSQRCEMGSGGFLPHSHRDLQFELSLNWLAEKTLQKLPGCKMLASQKQSNLQLF